MKKIVLTPNPYRDRNFKYVTLADKLLREAGLETRICLAFDVDRSFELPDNVVLTELHFSWFHSYDYHQSAADAARIIDPILPYFSKSRNREILTIVQKQAKRSPCQ